jgi:DNA-binding protein H-NS
MAKSFNLLSMSVDDLLKLRDDVTNTLTRRAHDLKLQLSRLAGSGPKRGRPAKAVRAGRKGPAKGSKVAPKYRGPEGETWSGRGLKPRWLQAALQGGKTLDDFRIAGAAPRKSAKGARKGRGRKKKAA